MDGILPDIQGQHGGSQFHCKRGSRCENGACLALTFPALTFSMAGPHFQLLSCDKREAKDTSFYLKHPREAFVQLGH